MIKIIIDDYVTLSDGIAQESYNFDVDLSNGGHTLKITHYGKQNKDHMLDDQGIILIDKHIEITSVEFDDIKLEEELWAGRFYPVYNHKKPTDLDFISPNLYLGYNGTWILEFATPAAAWLVNKRHLGPVLSGTIFKTNTETLEQAKDFFKDMPDV